MNQFDKIGTWCSKCNNVMCICEAQKPKLKNPLPTYESDVLNEFLDRPKKPFYVHNVRSVLNELNREEISFSRMVEKLNEIAFEFYKHQNNK